MKATELRPPPPPGAQSPLVSAPERLDAPHFLAECFF